MSIRRDPIYLSSEVWRALWLLARSVNGPKLHESLNTPDALADDILRKTIQKDYPQLFEHQKEIDKLEKKVIESLKK